MEFNGNPNIGIYMFANDKLCLVGQKITEKKQKEIEQVLNVPVYQISILGTELVGIFIAGNNNFILIPQIFEKEKKELEKICKKHNVKLIEITDIQNTFGNNICFGNKNILVNGNYSKEFIQKLKKETQLKTTTIKSKIFESVGSTAIYLNDKYFLSQEYEEKDVKNILEEIAGTGTINQGSNYISSGIIGNSFGVIIGSYSSTIEIQNIVESLDYI